MVMKTTLTICLLYFTVACQIPDNTSPSSGLRKNKVENDYTYEQVQTNRGKAGSVGQIALPKGYSIYNGENNLFGKWLQGIALKPNDTVFLYNGKPKTNQSAQYAVLDISVPPADLQQCADAVMRLRADFLYETKQYNKLVFYDVQRKKISFLGMLGLKEQDSNFNYVEITKLALNTVYRKFLIKVFGYCNTYSLARDMPTYIKPEQVQAGDVFIRGGFPGHAVMVMAVVHGPEGVKAMLAQSYMPAQDIHILKNEDGTPWFSMNFAEILETPEYTFDKTELMRF
jgi:hypothetical protein